MHPRDLEPEMEDLLLRLAPDLDKTWRGAAPDEIEQLESLAGRPLPRFYRWFLTRMGTSVGSLQFRSLDFSVGRILSCYAEGLVTPDPSSLLIGFETDEIMPLHLFYDFDHPATEDARVVSMDFKGGLLNEDFDAFREMVAWGQFTNLRISRMVQSCAGLFDREGDQTLSRLDVVMKKLGFSKPVPMGPNCAVYDRQDAGMSASTTLGEPQSNYFSFHFGAPDAGTIRRLLGVISSEMSLQLEIDEWKPLLPDPSTAP